MRLVRAISGSSVSGEPARDAVTPLPTHHALVAAVQAAVSFRREGASGRPAVPFLAQLIATRHGHAQTRLRRRVDVGEATGAYRRMANSAPSPGRRRWGRSI
jgi:hypothetical protein